MKNSYFNKTSKRKHLLVSLCGILCENPRKNGKVGSHRRMKPFILALGRKIITEIIRPQKVNIKRNYTYN